MINKGTIINESPEISLDRFFSGDIKFTFGSSAPGILPHYTIPEFVFMGKSNVGKSSFINALTNRKALARVSHTPGRTQQINFFNVRDSFYLVDLPGYGYAKISKKIQNSWGKLIYSYLSNRGSLLHAFILIDGRLGIKENDISIFNLLNDLQISYSIIYTKCDKISNHAKELLLNKTQSKVFSAKEFMVFLTSARSLSHMSEFKSYFYKLITK